MHHLFFVFPILFSFLTYIFSLQVTFSFHSFCSSLFFYLKRESSGNCFHLLDSCHLELKNPLKQSKTGEGPDSMYQALWAYWVLAETTQLCLPFQHENNHEQINGCACDPIKLYLWALKFELTLIFTRYQIFFFGFLPPII